MLFDVAGSEVEELLRVEVQVWQIIECLVVIQEWNQRYIASCFFDSILVVLATLISCVVHIQGRSLGSYVPTQEHALPAYVLASPLDVPLFKFPFLD